MIDLTIKLGTFSTSRELIDAVVKAGGSIGHYWGEGIYDFEVAPTVIEQNVRLVTCEELWQQGFQAFHRPDSRSSNMIEFGDVIESAALAGLGQLTEEAAPQLALQHSDAINSDRGGNRGVLVYSPAIATKRDGQKGDLMIIALEAGKESPVPILGHDCWYTGQYYRQRTCHANDCWAFRVLPDSG